MSSPGLLLYCRAGFETACAAEAQAWAAQQGWRGEIVAPAGAAFVRMRLHGAPARDELPEHVHWRALAFARQSLVEFAHLADLPAADRAGPLAAAAAPAGPYGGLWLEYPDTNEGKALSGLARALATPLRVALAAHRCALDVAGAARLHVFLASGTAATLALAQPERASPWPLGIARLSLPRAAPSRATLKLAEAFLVLLSERERGRELRPGLHAVDLGAAPGGWTWQMVSRRIHVTAVDNGALDPALLDSGLVRHLRADGLRYRPRRPVDWLLCDMVEQPARIARLMADWIAEGAARQAMFTLKLPMKKRHEEIERARALIAQRLGGAHVLRLKHLYHDREELTGYLRRT